MNNIEINKNDVIRFKHTKNMWTIKYPRGCGYMYKDRCDSCVGHVNKDWLHYMIRTEKAELIKSKTTKKKYLLMTENEFDDGDRFIITANSYKDAKEQADMWNAEILWEIGINGNIIQLPSA